MTTLRAIILLSFIGIFTASSCYQYEEGCLDELATNYNIAADSACDDCCEYPSISIIQSHLVGDNIPYGADSVLTNKFGQSYKISKAFFFLNDFRFTFEDNNTLQVIEETAFRDSNNKNEVELPDDYTFVTLSNNTGKIGTMKRNGIIKNIKTTLGIPHSLIPQDQNHLLVQHDSLYNNTSYTNFVIEVRYGDEYSTSKRFEIKGTEKLLNISQEINLLKEKRSSISINSMIRYDLITDELNFDTADNDAFFEVLKKTDWLNFK